MGNRDTVEHFERLNRYFNFSRWKYNFFLNGSKHFGYYPDEKWLPTKQAQELMQDLVAQKINLGSGMRVLDAGCGQGVTSAYLAQNYGCFVEGITVVPFEIQEANRLAKKLRVADHVRYSFMDYSRLEFSDASFDAVYTQESLVHALDFRTAINEFFRVLKKAGSIALFEYSMAEDSKFSPKELRTMREMSHASAMHSFPEMRHSILETLMSEVGFRNVKIENISRKVVPMLKQYEKFVKPIYLFFRVLGMTDRMPNLVAAARMVEFGEKDLVRYNIYTAQK